MLWIEMKINMEFINENDLCCVINEDTLLSFDRMIFWYIKIYKWWIIMGLTFYWGFTACYRSKWRWQSKGNVGGILFVIPIFLFWASHGYGMKENEAHENIFTLEILFVLTFLWIWQKVFSRSFLDGANLYIACEEVPLDRSLMPCVIMGYYKLFCWTHNMMIRKKSKWLLFIQKSYACVQNINCEKTRLIIIITQTLWLWKKFICV